MTGLRRQWMRRPRRARRSRSAATPGGVRAGVAAVGSIPALRRHQHAHAGVVVRRGVGVDRAVDANDDAAAGEGLVVVVLGRGLRRRTGRRSRTGRTGSRRARRRRCAGSRSRWSAWSAAGRRCGDRASRRRSRPSAGRYAGPAGRCADKRASRWRRRRRIRSPRRPRSRRGPSAASVASAASAAVGVWATGSDCGACAAGAGTGVGSEVWAVAFIGSSTGRSSQARCQPRATRFRAVARAARGPRSGAEGRGPIAISVAVRGSGGACRGSRRAGARPGSRCRRRPRARARRSSA